MHSKLLSLLAFFSCFVLMAHDIHLSVLEIKWAKDGKYLECALKVFSDDIQEASSQTEIKTYNHYSAFEGQQDPRIFEYVKQNILFDQKANYSLIGMEEQDISTWIYFEVKFLNSQNNLFQKVRLTNNMLFDLFDDQENIVHYLKKEKKESFLLHNANNRIDLSH